MQQHKSEPHIVCPCCNAAFPASAAQHYPAVKSAWKKRGNGKHDPAAVTMQELADDPESFRFED